MTPAGLSHLIKEKLDYLLIVRSTWSALPHLLLLGFLTYQLDYDFLFHQNHVYIILAILILTAIRLGTGVLYIKSDSHSMLTKRQLFWSHFAVLIGIAMTWTWLEFRAIQLLGFKSYSTLMLTIYMMGILSGTSITFSPVPWVRTIYTTILFIPVAVASALYTAPPFGWTFVSSLILFYIFLFQQGSHSHKEVRSRIESELIAQAERKRLQDVVNSVPGFILCLNSEGTVQAMNQQLPQLLGGEFKTGERIPDIVSPELRYQITRFNLSPYEIESREIEIDTTEGRQWFLMSFHRVTDPIQGLVVVGSPINELKKIRDDLNEQRAKAHYASRLAALGEMAAGIAHEINNPLAIITSYSANIRILLASPEQHRESINSKLQMISTTCQRIAKIVSGLLDFSRDGQKDPFVPVSITKLLDTTLELCKERFYRNGIFLEVVITENEVSVMGRETQLSQVLINLLNNSFDAVSNLSEKWVRVDLELIHGKSVRIKITDSGKGIDQTVAEKIFSPFYTTKPVGQGTGLGLSVARSIVQDHGGRLEIDPQHNQTCFLIDLPITS